MKAPTPKPRAKRRKDAKLSPEKLGMEKFAELVEGLCGPWGYLEAAEWLKAECGETLSQSGWSGFHQRYVAPVLKERMEFAMMGARAMETQAKEAGVFDDATILEIRRKGYQMLRDPSADPEETRKWMETYIKMMVAMREREKAQQMAKSKIEAGLEALYQEIKGNRKAEAAFKIIQEEVKAA
jgi:hypothetical protein